MKSVPFSDVEPALLVGRLLEHYGVNLENPHIIDTPKRVAKMYEELLAGYGNPPELTMFPVEGVPSLVTVSNIAFYSLCAHHIIPFGGVAHISYLPSDKLCGLSKLARVVKHFSARLQIQEELTEQIAHYLEKELKPAAVGVIMVAEHLCMAMRGIRLPGSKTTTSAMRGKFKDDYGLKEEFFKIIDWGGS